MPFKIKDLMISDLSKDAQKNAPPTCRPVTQLCTYVTCAECTLFSFFQGCFGGTGLGCGERTTDTTCTAVTHGVCTNLTGGDWPTITCGACTAVTRGGCTACSIATGGQWQTITCGACTVVTRGGWPTITCGACTAVTHGNCTNITCGDCTWDRAKAENAGTSPDASLAALSILKEQLKQQLAEVETEQAAIEKSMLPQTVEQVDELSAKLTDALRELEALRRELSSKAKPADDK
jgi:hypothetical protein